MHQMTLFSDTKTFTPFHKIKFYGRYDLRKSIPYKALGNEKQHINFSGENLIAGEIHH